MSPVRPAVLLALFAFAASGPAFGQPAAEAVKARQANFKQLGGAFKQINDALKADTPDRALIQANAIKADQLAGKLGTWFPRGSGPESGVETAAKAEAWTDAAGFAAAARALKAETAKLAQLSLNGDADALRAQGRAVGATCKSCHDKFRVPK